MAWCKGSNRVVNTRGVRFEESWSPKGTQRVRKGDCSRCARRIRVYRYYIRYIAVKHSENIE